jgi:hypothetical protein
MTWLTGIPSRTRRIQPVSGINADPRGTSILDDKVLQFDYSKEAKMTAVYIADISKKDEQVEFRKVAELVGRLYIVQLVKFKGDDVVYASVGWDKS